MWLTHFWHSWSQFFIFAWDVTAEGILRTGVLICLVVSTFRWVWCPELLCNGELTNMENFELRCCNGHFGTICQSVVWRMECHCIHYFCSTAFKIGNILYCWNCMANCSLKTKLFASSVLYNMLPFIIIDMQWIVIKMIMDIRLIN